MLILVGLMVIAGAKLVQVQWIEAPTLSAAAERQRTLDIDIPAQRGSILDRSGTKLAFSVEVRTLSVNLAAATAARMCSSSIDCCGESTSPATICAFSSSANASAELRAAHHSRIFAVMLSA